MDPATHRNADYSSTRVGHCMEFPKLLGDFIELALVIVAVLLCNALHHRKLPPVPKIKFFLEGRV
jgi:hypothetical protein